MVSPPSSVGGSHNIVKVLLSISYEVVGADRPEGGRPGVISKT